MVSSENQLNFYTECPSFWLSRKVNLKKKKKKKGQPQPFSGLSHQGEANVLRSYRISRHQGGLILTTTAPSAGISLNSPWPMWSPLNCLGAEEPHVRGNSAFFSQSAACPFEVNCFLGHCCRGYVASCCSGNPQTAQGPPSHLTLPTTLSVIFSMESGLGSKSQKAENLAAMTFCPAANLP